MRWDEGGGDCLVGDCVVGVGSGGGGRDMALFHNCVDGLIFTIHAVPIPWLEWPYLVVTIINGHHCNKMHYNLDVTATDAWFEPSCMYNFVHALYHMIIVAIFCLLFAFLVSQDTLEMIGVSQ